MSDDGMDQSDGAVLSGDAWEQSQYLPGASLSLMTEDPKKKTTPPPPLHRVLTGDEWERAQRLPGAAVKALQLPPIPQLAAPVDDTANPLSSRTKGKALAPFDIKDPTTYANPVLRQIVNPALDNPLQTVLTTAALAPAIGAGRVLAAGGAIGAAEMPALRASQAVGAAMAGQMVHSIASFGWQKLAEMQLSPEDRKRAEADPERVSGEAAAVQAAMLGLAPLIHVGVKAMSGPSYGAGMLEAGASGVHEAMADPSVAPNRTAPFQGELNAAHAHALEEGAATTRIPADTPKPEGFQPTAGGARLKTNPRAPEGLVVPDKITTGKISPLDTQTPDQPLQDAANVNESVRDYQQGRVEQDQSDVSAARQADADRIAQETAMRPRRRPAKVPMFDTEQGAQVLGATAARHGLPDSASPYHPTSPTTAVLDAAWREGHDAGSQTGQSMLASMGDSGFATAPADASSVILPPEGAGRAGSTVDAVAIAKKLVGSAQLRVLADAELAKRGGPVTPEAQMAAMEQVARNLASREPRASAPEAPQSYPDGFSMGGALTDNRIPGAVELPKPARGADMVPAPSVPAPEPVTEAQALSRALLPPAQPPELSATGRFGDGTGELKTRGLSLGVEQTANTLGTTLGDLPRYETTNMAVQAERATDFVTRFPDAARRVAVLGEDAPAGIIPEAIFTALENKAKAEGDVSTLHDLAFGKLAQEATEMGQRIRALGERDPESAVDAMRKVSTAREAAVGDVPKESAKVVADIEKVIQKHEVSADQLKTFIDSLRC